jgi:hypothetical protein
LIKLKSAKPDRYVNAAVKCIPDLLVGRRVGYRIQDCQAIW